MIAVISPASARGARYHRAALWRRDDDTTWLKQAAASPGAPLLPSVIVQTLAFKPLASDLMLAVGGHTAWSELDWQPYASALGEQLRAFRAHGGCFITLIFVDDYGPNAKQRTQIAQLMQGLESKTAVLTDSKLADYLPLGAPGASTDIAGCVNLLTNKRFITPTSTGMSNNSCLLQVEKGEGEAS